MSAKLILDGMTLYVKDVDKSKAFYRDLVGLRLLGQEDHAVHFDATSARFSIHPAEGSGEGGTPGWVVFGVEGDLEAAYRELRGRGVPFDWPPTDKPYGRTAKFRDPDRHELYLWDPKGAAREFRDLGTRYNRVASKLRT